MFRHIPAHQPMDGFLLSLHVGAVVVRGSHNKIRPAETHVSVPSLASFPPFIDAIVPGVPANVSAQAGTSFTALPAAGQQMETVRG